VRDIARRILPAGATVLIVSKGDEDLVRLDGRHGWHFPQAESGEYAGYHPATSADAIQHLEALCDRGARYLLIPSTAFWWLDHYSGFAQHLDQHYRVIWKDEFCLVYERQMEPRSE
jgi:hypothetical protein